jgi:hypothetical protein
VKEKTMNIADDVLRDAQTALYRDHISDRWGETVPEIDDVCEEVVRIVAPVIAEWAMKESEKAVIALMADPAIYTTPAIYGVVGSFAAIRALTEGTDR